MPKKKGGATTPAATHPALLSDEGPERKTSDDLIIDDPETRALVSLLLGKWSEAKPLEDYYRQTLEKLLDFKEATERYHAGGQVNPTTMPEAFVKRWRRLESAAGRLEAIIGERIKARLIDALGEAVELAILRNRCSRSAEIRTIGGAGLIVPFDLSSNCRMSIFSLGSSD